MTDQVDRRRALRLLAGGAGAMLTVAPAVALGAASDPTRKAIALGAEIVRRCAEGEHFQKTRIDPIRGDVAAHCPRSVETRGNSDGKRAADTWTGKRTAAIRALEKFDLADGRPLLSPDVYTGDNAAGPRQQRSERSSSTYAEADGLGPPRISTGTRQWARTLLGEFAGMSAEELAAV